MSNAECRLKNEEVGIRVLIQMVLLRVLGTLPVCRRQVLRTLYNEIESCYLLLVTCYSFNAERRSKNEEVGIRVRTQMALLKVLGTLPACRRQVLGALYNEMESCYLLLVT